MAYGSKDQLERYDDELRKQEESERLSQEPESWKRIQDYGYVSSDEGAY